MKCENRVIFINQIFVVIPAPCNVGPGTHEPSYIRFHPPCEYEEPDAKLYKVHAGIRHAPGRFETTRPGTMWIDPKTDRSKQTRIVYV